VPQQQTYRGVPQAKAWESFTRGLLHVGYIAFFVGLALQRIRDSWDDVWVLSFLIAGGTIFVVCAALNWNWIVRAIAQRRTLIGANVAAMILMALALLVMANYVGYRHYWRKDMTKSSRYTLSDKTKNILKGLDKDVKITMLFDPQTSEWYPEVRDLLDEYDHRSKHITVEETNPLRNKMKVEELAKRLKIDSIELNSVIFECGKKSKHIPQSDMIEYPPTMNPYMSQRQPPQFKGEDTFTSAILDVTEKKQAAIYFVQGHGERDIDNYDDEGLSQASKALKRDNYKVEKLQLATKMEIPDDCTVLVIMGPTKRFSDDELDVVRTYIDDEDGKVMIGLDPIIDERKQEESGLEPILEDMGVKIRRDLVVFNRINHPLFGAQTTPQVFVSGDGYGYHKIVEKMKTQYSSFYTACLVGEGETKGEQGEPGNTGMRVTSICKTIEASWGETNFASRAQYDEGTDEKGPISIAVAVQPKPKRPPMPYGPPPEEPKKGCRLVVFGDSDFCTNQMIKSPGNLTLFMNCINWLAKKESHLGIPPKSPDFNKIELQPQQRKAVFWSSVIGLPFLVLMLGAIVWWMRRS